LNFFKAAADIFGATFFGFNVLLLLAPTVVLLYEVPCYLNRSWIECVIDG
jgi:hypothetical protein